MTAHPNVYSPRSLAMSWGCSEQHVRNLTTRHGIMAAPTANCSACRPRLRR